MCYPLVVIIVVSLLLTSHAYSALLVTGLFCIRELLAYGFMIVVVAGFATTICVGCYHGGIFAWYVLLDLIKEYKNAPINKQFVEASTISVMLSTVWVAVLAAWAILKFVWTPANAKRIQVDPFLDILVLFDILLGFGILAYWKVLLELSIRCKCSWLTMLKSHRRAAVNLDFRILGIHIEEEKDTNNNNIPMVPIGLSESMPPQLETVIRPVKYVREGYD